MSYKRTLILVCMYVVIAVIGGAYCSAATVAAYPFSGKVTNEKLEPIDGVKVTVEVDGGSFTIII